MTVLHPVSSLPLRDPAGHRIGDILIEQGKLSNDDADRVSRIQPDKNARFGEVARELGLVSEKDIEFALARQFSYPYLAPGESRLSPTLVAAYEPFSDQAETLRAVRNQLARNWFNAGRKAIAVVSCGPEEGTSTFAGNLAIAFAQSNERTLLIDANLRSPTQHTLFHTNGNQGLSDMLSGRRLTDQLMSVPPFDKLFILPAGTIPPNPQELLRHLNFGVLHERLSSQFDVILLDVPSLALHEDGLIVAACCGGALLVVRKNATRMADVTHGMRQLKRAGIALAGYVMVDF